MDTLRILALHHITPDNKSVVTLVLENLIPVLKTKVGRVHLIWVVYTPEKLQIKNNKDPDITIIDIHDYHNALEIIQKEKPDVIFATADPNVIDYAFSLAGKFLGIPVVSGLLFRTVERTKARLLRTYLTSFFQSSTPVDTDENQKQFMRRGRFFIYKYRFLLKTQRSIKMSRFKTFKNFFMLLQIYLTHTGFQLYPQFANTLHWLDSEYYLEPAIKAKFDRSSIVITGNPMYDSIFQKIEKLKPVLKKDNKIHVLFITVGLYEHGYWTRKQRDDMVQEIVKELTKHKDEMSLVVKIHPSAEVLTEYQSLINSVDPDVPVYQKGDILEFLYDADVVLCPAPTSALEYSLLLKKPIIICNFTNDKGNVFLESGLALECKQSSSIIPSIYQILKSDPATKEKVDDYIRHFLYKVDGHASERVCDAIMKILEKR